MLPMPYVADRATVEQANALISDFGETAGVEAAARANRSRSIGNVALFCRWRQIERLISILSADRAVATIH
jgi:hypothetical protein